MGAVTISKSPSVVVKPWEPVTAAVAGSFINLSSYDRPLVGSPLTICLVFEEAIKDPAETIKRGLSKALLYYYPMSGRLAAGATGGEVVVQCNGEGVSFVAASANCALNDVQELHDPSVQEELAIFYPAGPGRVPGMPHTDPLLLMQVTVFRCGGFVVGLTWEHSIADGTGIGQFMQAVGELSRGLPSPSVIPVRSAESLIGVPQITNRIITLMHSLQPSLLVLLDTPFPSSLINRIKQDFSSSYSGARTCSLFEVLTAVLWQCRTRAVMEEEDPEAPTALFFVANARRYAGANHGYYGNCLSGQLVMTTYGAVADGDIMDVIKMIQQAKDQISGQYSSDDLLQELDAKSLHGYNIFCVNYWRNLGLEKADFGGGRPASRVMAYTKDTTCLPECLLCLPWNSNELYSVSSLCVREEYAGAYLRELANLT